MSNNINFNKSLSSWVKNHLAEKNSPISLIELNADQDTFKKKIEESALFEDVAATVLLLKVPFVFRDVNDNDLNQNNYNLLDCLTNNVAKIDGAFYNVVDNAIWLNSFFNRFNTLRNECLYLSKVVAQDFNSKYGAKLNEADGSKIEKALLKNLKVKSFNQIKEWKETRLQFEGIKKRIKLDEERH